MPRQYYVYLPFRNPSLERVAVDWQDCIRWFIHQKILREIRASGRAQFGTDFSAGQILGEIMQRTPSDPDSRKIPIICAHGDKKSLNRLRDDIGWHDVFYILVDGIHLPVVTSGASEFLTAEGLVARMINDRVPARVSCMKLYCHRGGNGSESSFAQQMRLAMNKPFPDSTLHVYTKSVGDKLARYADPRTYLLKRQMGRPSDSRISLAPPLSEDEIDEGRGAINGDLVEGIEAVNQLFTRVDLRTRTDQLAVTSRGSAWTRQRGADQGEGASDAFEAGPAAQSED